jgi:acyl-CoA reductase-like NAD-dependent aldehyde dehydrogenase
MKKNLMETGDGQNRAIWREIQRTDDRETRVLGRMLGVNVGVAAPMAFFPFSGRRKSFFGDLHATGRDGVEFYTTKKVITTRWF